MISTSKQLSAAVLALCAFNAGAVPVARTGQNAVKVAAVGGIRTIGTPAGGEEPAFTFPAATHSVCSSGCDYTLAQLAGGIAITERSPGDVLEIQAATPGGTVTVPRVLCTDVPGAADNHIWLKIRDGDIALFDSATGSGVGLLDTNCSYWTFAGTSTGTTGLELGDDTVWNTTCAKSTYATGSPARYLCYQNRKALVVRGSPTGIAFVNMTIHGAGGDGGAYTASSISPTATQILVKNVAFDLHGTNNYDGSSDSGDLIENGATGSVFVDVSFTRGGHRSLRAKGYNQVYRRITCNGDWTAESTGYPGNWGCEFASSKSRAGGYPTVYGPMLIEDSVFTKNQDSPDTPGGVWQYGVQINGQRTIFRGNYFIDSPTSYLLSTCSFTQMNTSALQGRISIYNNTSSGSAVFYQGDFLDGDVATDFATSVCERTHIKNNIFANIPTGPRASWPWAFQFDQDGLTAILGSYTNSMKGAEIMYNVTSGPSANLQVRFNGTGAGTYSLGACDPAANICNNTLTAPTFINGSTTPANTKAGFALSPSSAVGVGDATALTTTTDAGTTDTTLTLGNADWIFDPTAITYDWEGLYTEPPQCIAVTPLAGGAASTAVVTKVTSLVYSTGAIVVTPGVTHAIGSNVWPATGNEDGTCGSVWDNRGAAQ